MVLVGNSWALFLSGGEFVTRTVSVCVSLEPCVCVCVCVCVCTCARILTDDIDMITHHLSGDIATTEDVIGC